ncbi:MAG: alkyl hydroperoxide reductase [Cytophagaceae bacterium]|nr:alkyl hydroperoxide reductase [Cytophagaceae bacterium]|tara:strand:- start:17768 stop:18244 length:477 start_codon:yes stop_codon:yes gene_type:complete
MKLSFFALTFFVFLSIHAQETFENKALAENMLSMDGDEVTFEQILEAHKGKPVLIDIWASWCKDCIAGFPKLKELQAKNTQMDYVFLSLDKEIDRWKNGIEKYALAGDHYYIKAGWKGDFCTSIDLDWIPRYILLDAKGKIKVYRAIETTDQNLLNQL